MNRHVDGRAIAIDRGLVDLTMPMSERTTPAPGHPSTELERIDRPEDDGMRNTVMRASIHTGTHVDAPSLLDHGPSIDQIPIERFWRPGVRLDLTDAGPGERIDRARIEAAGFSSTTASGAILLLATGWTDRVWGSERLYREHPFLAEDATQALAAGRPAALGVDFAIDTGTPWPNHTILLRAEVALIENLMGLPALPADGFEVIAFPLRLTGEGAGPARVVASLPI